jgi:hypothetical protein
MSWPGTAEKKSHLAACPRCAAALQWADDDQSPPCDACGWNFDDGEPFEGEEVPT